MDLETLLEEANQEETGAQIKLGLLYETGSGVTRNYEEATKWYRLAALDTDPLAQFNLGKMFANGYGVEQDDVQAWMWSLLAQEFNYMSMRTDHELEEQIDKMLDELKGRMTDSEIEEAKELVEQTFKSSC